MSDNVHQIVESHHCYCEVSPYYIVSEERPVRRPVSVRRVHAGFDVDIYGVITSREPDPPAEYWLVYTKLKEAIEVIRHGDNHSCCIEVIPFGATVVLDAKNHLQPLALLRIRITHNRGVHEATGATEQEALKAVEAQLSSLGIATGGSRA